VRDTFLAMSMKSERIGQLLNSLKSRGGLTVGELAESLNVTEITIRRYLSQLEKDNRVKFMNKGVILLDPQRSYAYNQAIQVHAQEKKRIGEKAASLIEPHDTVIIDAGSTTEFLAEAIDDEMPITVFTYALNIINIICNKPNCAPIIAGGTYYRNTISFLGPSCIDLMKQIRASKVFISASGVSETLGVTGLNLYEMDPKKSAIEASHTKILLADSSKFDQVKIAHIANLDDFDIIITDTNVPRHYELYARDHGITLIKA
jgi:DeoR family transcriptional regulator, deoxyribose operon repressor